MSENYIGIRFTTPRRIQDNPLLSFAEAEIVKDEVAMNVKAYGAKGDGITDDSAAFQAAVNQTGKIFVPEGTYIVNTRIMMPSNTYLCGERGSILKATQPLTDAIIVFESVHHSGVCHLEIDCGNQPISFPIAPSTYQPGYIHIRGDPTTFLNPSTNIEVLNCEMYDGGLHEFIGLEVNNNYCNVNYNYLHDFVGGVNNVVINHDSADFSIIHGNVFENITSGICIRLHSCENSTVSANRFFGHGEEAIACDGRYNIITDNQIQPTSGNTSNQIYFVADGGFDNDGNIIKNNILHSIVAVSCIGINIAHTTNGRNVIDGNSIENLSTGIICSRSTCVNNQIEHPISVSGIGIQAQGNDNIVCNNKLTNLDTGLLITIGANNTVSNNMALDCATGIGFRAQNNSVLSNNIVRDATLYSILFTNLSGSATVNSVIANNICYSPVSTPTYDLYILGASQTGNLFIGNRTDSTINIASANNKFINNFGTLQTFLSNVNVSMTTDDQQITSFSFDWNKITFTSDNATPANRTALLNAGFYIGQTVLLLGPTVNSMEIAHNTAAADGTLTFLRGGANLTLGNTFVVVRFDGTNWYEA